MKVISVCQHAQASYVLIGILSGARAESIILEKETFFLRYVFYSLQGHPLLE